MKLSNTLTRIAGFLILISVCAMMSMCRNSQPKGSMSLTEASEWIETFCCFAASDEIVIEFKTPCALDTTNTIKLKDVAWFSPAVRGDVTLSEDGTLMTITPSKELQQGMVYRCDLNMDKIFGVDSLKNFDFDIYVLDRVAELKQVNCKVSQNDLDKAEISGFVTFNLTPTPEELEMIKVFPEVGELEINFTEDSRTISFTITDIPRKSEEYEITVSLDYGCDFNWHKQTVKVPSLTSFRIMDAEFVEAAIASGLAHVYKRAPGLTLGKALRKNRIFRRNRIL